MQKLLNVGCREAVFKENLLLVWSDKKKSTPGISAKKEVQAICAHKQILKIEKHIWRMKNRF
jgi:hypothetical protein